MDGQDNAEQILSLNDFLITSTLPTPRTAEKLAESINDTVINGQTQTGSGTGGITFGQGGSERLSGLLDHQANEHSSEMVKAPRLEMRVESLMRDDKKVGELLGVIETKEMRKGQDHQDLKGERVAFSKLRLKEGEKLGSFKSQLTVCYSELSDIPGFAKQTVHYF